MLISSCECRPVLSSCLCRLLIWRCRYMNDSVIVEAGTHDALMKKEGEYARIWMLQAEAFL